MIPWFAPAELVYGAGMRRRRSAMLLKRSKETAPCPILSIGNLTVGGTGKTPATQWAALLLQAAGYKVAVVSRGYGGSCSGDGAVVSDGETIFLGADQSGDEPLLHATRLPGVPVVIGRDRHRAIETAVEKCGAQVVVLDDGFQYWSVPRAIDVVLLDARRPFDGAHMVPCGRLREEPEALGRADLILLTRANLASEAELESDRLQIGRYSTAPIFEANHKPLDFQAVGGSQRLQLSEIDSKRVMAVSALADNMSFFRTLESLGARIVQKYPLRDHAKWTMDFCARIERRARELKVDALVMTEKDAVKWHRQSDTSLPVWCLRVALDLGSAEGELGEWMLSRLEAVA